jgi:hypothetical protein
LKDLPDDNLPDCFMTICNSPKMIIEQEGHAGAENAFTSATQRNTLWIMLRNYLPRIPGWGGYVSLTGDPPHRLTTIGYYPVIQHPITEYKTVQQCLKLAEEASHEVGQNYVIITFDLGVCMKAYPLI